MNHTDQLDSFETALLTELRREVAEHPAPAPAPRRHPRRRLKVVAAGAVATAVATVVAVGLTGGAPTASPAFAVTGNSDGSVDLVIHRLDDASGLEAALGDQGIDATVHFVPTPDGSVPDFDHYGPFAHDEPGPQNSCGIDNGPGPAMLVTSDLAASLGTTAAELGADPDGSDYILDIPADSVLQDRPVTFYVGSPGSFSIVYPSSLPGLHCGFGQSQLFKADSGNSSTRTHARRRQADRTGQHSS